uniref:Ig-like domain-containing protein n=1 Tax=Podarcis muralis TaxID=64176 RepID=A0A670HMJ6_PODMU
GRFSLILLRGPKASLSLSLPCSGGHPGGKSGEFLLEFDNEEILHVDWEKKQNVWRLPDFQRFTSFEVQGALANIAVMKNNMEVLMKRSNRTRALNVAPSATVYPENAVELGDPNVLICFVDRFSPPVLNVTWLKNNEVVSEGVEETDFYPSVDNSFRKFSYLPFVPEQGDIYVCQVEHWGIPEGKMEKIWETMENVLCALGLAFGILGIHPSGVSLIPKRIHPAFGGSLVAKRPQTPFSST